MRGRCKGSGVLLGVLTSLALAAAEPPTPESRLDVLRSGEGQAAFAQALEPRAFEFPRDHGPHPEFRHEWWYLTGHLDAQGGARFGFEVTFFRFALAPSVPEGSRWRTRQIYMAHFAVTDVPEERFHFTERFSRGALGLAGAQAQPFRVWLEDWNLEEALEGAGWELRVQDEAYALELELRTLVPPVPNGEAGLSRKSAEPGAASYYYSIPRLAVSGTVHRGTQALEVRGLAWLDREWGSGALGREQEGWDWFALQLADGSTLMFYSLRTAAGRDPASAGTWVAPDGTERALGSEDVRIDVLDHWESPRGGRYPSEWRLRVPSLALDVQLTPVLADQELATSTRYWEGAVDVRGARAGRDVAGRGYVELVGYAR